MPNPLHSDGLVDYEEISGSRCFFLEGKNASKMGMPRVTPPKERQS